MINLILSIIGLILVIKLNLDDIPKFKKKTKFQKAIKTLPKKRLGYWKAKFHLLEKRMDRLKEK